MGIVGTVTSTSHLRIKTSALLLRFLVNLPPGLDSSGAASAEAEWRPHRCDSGCCCGCSVVWINKVWLFVTPWTSLSFVQTLVHWVGDAIQPSHPLSVFPSIRVFSNESLALCIRWPKYWNFSFSIGPSSEYSGLIDGWDPLRASLQHMSAISVGWTPAVGVSTWPLGSLRACVLTGFQQDKSYPRDWAEVELHFLI